MREEKLFKQILFFGPQYKNHRGGMGAVLESYAEVIRPFQFIATYPEKKSESNIVTIFFFCMALFKTVFLLIFKRRIRIVHIHSASRGSFLRKYIVFFISKYFFQKKVVFHLHSGEFHNFYRKSGSFSKNRIKELMNRVDCVICLSTQWYQFLSDNFKIKRLYVLNNPVQNMKVDTFCEKSSIPLNLLFLGIITDKKGIFDLIDVLQLFTNDLQNKVRLNIGGVGDTERLFRTIQDKQLTNQIQYLGWVDKQKKDQALRSCDVFILPSYYEGLPISVLEAMSYGKPVITTNVGGVPAVVEDGYNGFLVEPGDRNGFYKSIIHFINNPHQLESMGKASLKKVEPYYTETVVQELSNLYCEILNLKVN